MADDNRCYRGIFGSPEEPFFNDKQHGVAPDILKEWLIRLNLKNKEEIESAALVVKQDYFYHSDAVCFIFKTCERFRLPNRVKYHAAELFERFMLQHVRDLYEHLKTTESRNRMKKWEEILGRIQNQVLLRLVSCCQIASKITSHYKYLNVKRARNFLRDINLRYSANSILNSEIRVLKTLNYNVLATSSMVYLETILEIVGYNEQSLSVKQYHAVAIKVMDVVYLKKREIYEELFLVITKHQTPTMQETQYFHQVKTDKLLLAISVLTASVYIVDQPSTDKMIEQLQKITKRSSEDILDFATVIVQSVLQGCGDIPDL